MSTEIEGGGDYTAKTAIPSELISYFFTKRCSSLQFFAKLYIKRDEFFSKIPILNLLFLSIE